MFDQITTEKHLVKGCARTALLILLF